VDAPSLLVVVLGLVAGAGLVIAVLGAQRAGIAARELELSRRRARELRQLAQSAAERVRVIERVRARETRARLDGEPIPMRETVWCGETITVRGTVRVRG